MWTKGVQEGDRGWFCRAGVLDPLASPLFADLAGLAPLLVQVGTAEILLSDSQRLAAAALRAGVELIPHVEPGAPHVHPRMLDDEPARAVTHTIGAFLRGRRGTSSRRCLTCGEGAQPWWSRMLRAGQRGWVVT